MTWVIAMVLVFTGTGCATSQPVAPPESASVASPPSADVEHHVRDVVDDWTGTPHVLGGTSRDGLDCSSFVQVVYRAVFQMDLPRTTRQQVETGRRVRRDALRAGDLVFFRTGLRQRHVGVYLSDGEFAHVSGSQGVTTSRLDDEYWHDRYWTSRRLTRPSEPEAMEVRAGW